MKMHCYALWLEGVVGMEVKLWVISWKGLKEEAISLACVYYPLV
jgi:hypothetical protein